MSGQRWRVPYKNSPFTVICSEGCHYISANRTVWNMSNYPATARSHMCSLPSRTEEEWREIKEREGNPTSTHSQHNCTGGGILLVKHWAGMCPVVWVLIYMCTSHVTNDFFFFPIRLLKLNFSLKYMRKGLNLFAYKRPKVCLTILTLRNCFLPVLKLTVFKLNSKALPRFFFFVFFLIV